MVLSEFGSELNLSSDLQQQLNEKDARLNQQQEQLENQTREHRKLQDDFDSKFEPIERFKYTIFRFLLCLLTQNVQIFSVSMSGLQTEKNKLENEIQSKYKY